MYDFELEFYKKTDVAGTKGSAVVSARNGDEAVAKIREALPAKGKWKVRVRAFQESEDDTHEMDSAPRHPMGFTVTSTADGDADYVED